ncbi:MAG: DUF4178 domain-containing protein [Burkholderiales bacterium]|nr:DUF4178 domain-containing protein [Burkholderiales bacterium]
MQKVSCPSCGAPVEFKSHASVMAVCGFCKTTVLKDADKVKDMGRMSDVLEDYSPIQIGTSGTYGGQEFTVIGRIQLRYPAGMWNEWYVMRSDGSGAWLSDASGQYTFTLEKKVGGSLPQFGEVRVGTLYKFFDRTFIASDVREAECIGGQGELPFKVGPGWQARLADLRCGRYFLTLDYSDSPQPTAYVGESVTLAQMKCQLLRDDDTVRDSAGELKAKVQPLSCPSCGSSVGYVPGLTRQIVCPSCRSQIDASTNVLQVLDVAERMEQLKTTLELGAKATISGAQYEMIGALRSKDDEGSVWTEYLMYNPRAGFLWLIETDEGWQRGKVMDDWPKWNRGETAVVGNQTYKKLYEYTSEVISAAGAFNWKVQAGDKARVIEFESGKNRLAAELTPEELNWTWSTPVGADQIRAWFGKEIKADKLPPKTDIEKIAKYFLWGIIGFNAIPLLLEFDRTWLVTAFAAAAVWIPAKLISWMQDKS